MVSPVGIGKALLEFIGFIVLSEVAAVFVVLVLFALLGTKLLSVLRDDEGITADDTSVKMQPALTEIIQNGKNQLSVILDSVI